MKNFLFAFSILDGDNEYLQLGIVSAQHKLDANKKALKVTGAFLRAKMKWSEKDQCFEPNDSSEYRIVKYKGIMGEATPELLLSRLSW